MNDGLVLYIKSEKLQVAMKNCYKINQRTIITDCAGIRKKSQQMLMNLVHVLNGRKKRSVAIKAQQKAT